MEEADNGFKDGKLLQPSLSKIQSAKGGAQVVRGKEPRDKTELLKKLLLDSHMRILECTNNSLPILEVSRTSCLQNIWEDSFPVLQFSRKTCSMDISGEYWHERSHNVELLDRHIQRCEALTYLREKNSRLIVIYQQNEIKKLTESNNAYEKELEELRAKLNTSKKLEKEVEEWLLKFDNLREDFLSREHNHKRQISQLTDYINELMDYLGIFAKVKETHTEMKRKLNMIIEDKPRKKLESEYTAVRKMANELNVDIDVKPSRKLNSEFKCGRRMANDKSAKTAVSRKEKVSRIKRNNEVILKTDILASPPKKKYRRTNS